MLVTKHIRPRNGNVEIAIAQPGGRVVEYEPLLSHCMSDEDAIFLGGEQQAYADRAFIHYGKQGFYFERPGTYRLRARYTAPDGSVILSETLTLRVRPPATAEDVEVADLLFGDEQGTLMYLVGSDFDGLRQGNDALTRIWEEHPEHPLADVARLIQGVNAARAFKEIQPDNTVRVREPDTDAAIGLLATRARPRRGEEDDLEAEGRAGEHDRGGAAAAHGDRTGAVRHRARGLHRRASA